MCDAIVLLISDRKGDRPIMFSHRLDEGLKSFGDHVDMIVCFWVGRFVTGDGSTKGNGVVNLGLGGMYRLKDGDSDSFNLRRRRGEAREVFLDLTGCRGGFLLVNILFECRKGAAW